jgi:hypothetical protein
MPVVMGEVVPLAMLVVVGVLVVVLLVVMRVLAVVRVLPVAMAVTAAHGGGKSGPLSASILRARDSDDLGRSDFAH